jgi:predicted CopG family antitoxin
MTSNKYYTITLLLMRPIKISDENRKKLLQLKLDGDMKSVDAVITELLKKK